MKREEAIDIIRKNIPHLGIGAAEMTEALTELIPELRLTEDERMMRDFNDWLCEEIECRTNDLRDEEDRRTLNMLTKVKDWLEKQEQKPEIELKQVTEEQLHNLNEAIKGLRMDGCERIADSLHSLYDILKTHRACLAWSEEDKRILKGIIGKIDHDQTYGVSKDEMLNFLKKL